MCIYDGLGMFNKSSRMHLDENFFHPLREVFIKGKKNSL
jgi:hypothetical protein